MCLIKRKTQAQIRQEVITSIIAEADAWVKRGEELTAEQAVAYLYQLIKIHDAYIRITTDDPAITGTDEWHQLWKWRYSQIISLISKLGGEI